MSIYLDGFTLTEGALDGMALKEAWLDERLVWSAAPPFVPRVVIGSVSHTGDFWATASRWWTGDREILHEQGSYVAFNVPVVASIGLTDRIAGPLVWARGTVIPAYTRVRPAPGHRGSSPVFTEVQQEG